MIFPKQAIHLATRSFRKAPGSAFSAALTLAMGFGAAAAIFSVMRGFGQPLPVPDGHRVVRISVQEENGATGQLTRDEIAQLASVHRSLERLGSFQVTASVISDGDDLPRRVQGARLDPEVLALLNVTPLMGRLPDRAGDPGVVLSRGLWLDGFDGSQDIVGRTVRVDGTPRAVVAVMPEGFEFPFGQHLWTFYDVGAEPSAEAQAVARLSEAATAAGASEEMELL